MVGIRPAFVNLWAAYHCRRGHTLACRSGNRSMCSHTSSEITAPRGCSRGVCIERGLAVGVAQNVGYCSTKGSVSTEITSADEPSSVAHDASGKCAWSCHLSSTRCRDTDG